jgi:hypothetical protein
LSKERHVSIVTVAGKLHLYLLDSKSRAVCIHVRNGEPAVQPTGTWSGLVSTGQEQRRAWSFQLCRVCSALHTQSPEQQEEQKFRSALLSIEYEDELRDG